MKIILNLFKVLIIILLLFILTQNANQRVDVHLLTYHFYQVNLYIVIILSLTLGAVLGAIFFAFYAVQAQSEIRKLQKRNKQLMRELENLRNLSIEDIPEEDIEEETPQLPTKKGNKE